MRLKPERAGRDRRINASIFLPCGFVAAAMGFTTERARWTLELLTGELDRLTEPASRETVRRLVCFDESLLAACGRDTAQTEPA